MLTEPSISVPLTSPCFFHFGNSQTQTQNWQRVQTISLGSVKGGKVPVCRAASELCIAQESLKFYCTVSVLECAVVQVTFMGNV